VVATNQVIAAAAATAVTTATTTTVTPAMSIPVQIQIHQLSAPVRRRGQILDLVPVMVLTATKGVTMRAVLQAATVVVAVGQHLRDSHPLLLVNLHQTIHYRLRALKSCSSGFFLTAAEIMV
jgi:hypothetical protein